VPQDREYLLRRLWQVTFASRMWLALTCPFCATKMDAEIDVDELPLQARPQQTSYAVCAAGVDVVFRLPRALDVEAVAGGGCDGRDRDAALMARCLISLGSAVDVTEAMVASLPAECRSAIEAAIEQACPDIGVELDACCPECSRRFEAACDMATHFLAELHRTRRELLRSIHLLSFHYHWPLREILRLSTAARRRYVGLLVRHLGSGRSTEAVRALLPSWRG
jgi:hypothetical protein